jgi:hypothetical protein
MIQQYMYALSLFEDWKHVSSPFAWDCWVIVTCQEMLVCDDYEWDVIDYYFPE